MSEVLHIKDWNDAFVHGINALEVADETWIQSPQNISGENDFDPERRQVTALTAMELLQKALPTRETMLTPWLPEKGLAMVHAPRGIGKTMVGIGVGWAIATGGEFLGWKAPRPRHVLYIDGEMPGADLQERIRRVVDSSQNQPPANDYFKIAAADLLPEGLPDLGDPEAQQFYADVVGDADCIIADNLSTLCPRMKENDADGWVSVQQWALAQRRAGKSVSFIHHDGKSGQQRGTSRKEDVLDTVIGLKRPPDYSADQGCRFELRFEKSRGFYGEEAAPFEAWLHNGEWQITEIKSGDDVETLKALQKQGLSIRDIAERTGISKSTVQRRLEGDI